MTMQLTDERPSRIRSARESGVRPEWWPVILPQTLRLSLRSVAAWSASLVALTVLYVSIWPSMRDMAGYRQIMENLPEAYRSILDASGAGDLTSASGYLNAELFAITGPLLVIILAVVAGSGAVAGTEHSRLLDGYLAQPISRARWAAEQAVAVTIEVFAVGAVMCAALILSKPLGDIDIPAGNLIAACLHLATLGVFFGLLAGGIGAATGRPSLTRAICGLVGLAGYVVHALAAMVSWLEPLRPFSPFRWYSGDTPLTTGVHPIGLLVLLATGIVLIAAGTALFDRRDLRA
jgi:ABC-2 type transport system permease protein